MKQRNPATHHEMPGRTAQAKAVTQKGAGGVWTSTLLPFEARKQLMEAASIKNPEQRINAVDLALAYIASHYPQYFLKQQ